MSVKRVARNRSTKLTSKLITFECTWTIESINRLCSDDIVGQWPVLYSPIFIAPPDKITTEDEKPVKFQLRFYPKGYDHAYQDYVGLFLELRNDPALDIMYVHSVVMANGLKHRLLTGIDQFDLTHLCGSNNMIRLAELLNQANGFVSNGSLTLHCELNIVVGELVKPDLDDQLKDKYSQSEMVTKSMGDLLYSGAHSDVTLVMVHDGGQELCAHKLILVARSRVFRTCSNRK